MTYPQQPQGYPQGYAQPAQYPAQPPMPQYPPAAPAYPAAPYPPQGGYPQPYPVAPAGPPLPTGTLDGFYEQPSGGGGPSFKFNGKAVGTTYTGIVARTVTNADVRAQTDQGGRPVTFKDGRTKFVMVVPMQVAPSPEFPEGVAGWWVKGQARDELARAMDEAGAPAGPPEAGAAIRVTLIGMRPIPGMNPAFQYRVEYVRPGGAAPVEQVPEAGAYYVSPTQQVAAPVQYQQPPMPQQIPVQPMPVQVQAPVAAAPVASAPSPMSVEQQALLAKLTGRPTG